MPTALDTAHGATAREHATGYAPGLQCAALEVVAGPGIPLMLRRSIRKTAVVVADARAGIAGRHIQAGHDLALELDLHAAVGLARARHGEVWRLGRYPIDAVIQADAVPRRAQPGALIEHVELGSHFDLARYRGRQRTAILPQQRIDLETSVAGGVQRHARSRLVDHAESRHPFRPAQCGHRTAGQFVRGMAHGRQHVP